MPGPEAKPGAQGESGGSSVKGAEVVSEPLGGGTLTQQEIRAVVLKHAELFDKCYLIGAGKSRDFVATVTVKATVAKSGTVTVTEVLKSTSKNPKVDACVADAFKQIKFPPPKGAATSVITFPIEFHGTEEVRAQ
jgi:TonB family protein